MGLSTLRLAFTALVALPLAAPAMAATAFPEGAVAPSADDIRQRLSDKVFDVQLANGTGWRVEFKANGYFFLDTSTGGKANGAWKAEDAKVCAQPSLQPMTCNEARVHEGYLYVQRANGEVIRYVPRP